MRAGPCPVRVPAFQAQAPVVFQGVLGCRRIRVPRARVGTPEGTDWPEAWVLACFNLRDVFLETCGGF